MVNFSSFFNIKDAWGHALMMSRKFGYCLNPLLSLMLYDFFTQALIHGVTKVTIPLPPHLHDIISKQPVMFCFTFKTVEVAQQQMVSFHKCYRKQGILAIEEKQKTAKFIDTLFSFPSFLFAFYFICLFVYLT